MTNKNTHIHVIEQPCASSVSFIAYYAEFKVNSIDECYKQDLPRVYAILTDPVKTNMATKRNIHERMYKNASIIYLYVPPLMRRRGIGSYLLYACATRCFYLFLDDMSDYFGKERNIYVNNGFLYVKKKYPEMTARASVVRRHVLRKCVMGHMQHISQK